MVYRGLGREVYSICLIRAINRLGDFADMVLVLLLSQTLSLQPHIVGLIVTAVFAFKLVGQISTGWIADRRDRKTLLMALEVAIALCYLMATLLIIAGRERVMIAPVILSALFRGGTAPVTNALTGDAAPRDKLTDAYSLLYLTTNVGVAIGSVIAGLLFSHLLLLFLLSTLMLILTALTVYILLPKASYHSTNSSRGEGRRAAELERSIAIFFFAVCTLALLTALFYNGTMFTLTLECGELFGAERGARIYSSLNSINALTVIVITPILTIFTRKFSNLSNMVLSMAFYVVGTSILLTSRESGFFIGMIIWTLGEICSATNINAYINTIIASSSRGFYNSIFLAFQSVGSVLAPTVMGTLASIFAYRTLWLLLGLLPLIIGTSYIVLSRADKERELS